MKNTGIIISKLVTYLTFVSAEKFRKIKCKRIYVKLSLTVVYISNCMYDVNCVIYIFLECYYFYLYVYLIQLFETKL